MTWRSLRTRSRR